jgi:hypothetical protein
MKGQDLAYQFYRQYGAPLIEAQFGDVAERIAVGLVGHGSECFGFDDDVSADHDYSVGFCMWLTDADYAAFGQALETAYLHLPQDFAGVRLQHTGMDAQTYRGVMRISDFYRPYVGDAQPPTDWRQWLSIDEIYLAEATNGSVFRDDLDAFSHIRRGLLHYPQDVRLKKLAAHLLLAAQSGQYNYARCVAHGEIGAAVLALNGYVEHIAHAVFLLADRYAPYYKWMLRAMDAFPLGVAVKPHLTTLLTRAHSAATLGEDVALIDEVARMVADALRAQGLSYAPNDYLEPHAYQVRRHIVDAELRALHIMQGV